MATRNAVKAVAAWLAGTLAACAFPPADPAAPPDLTRDSTGLAILTYNVKSLPFPLGGSRKRERLSAIRSRLHDYDLVLLQEAFTSVPDLLAGIDDGGGSVLSEHIGQAATGRGLTSSTGLAIASFGRVMPTSVRHVGHYGVCSGTFGRASDCLASKGFMMRRVTVAGHEIDVYDTHLDADARDQPARERQLAILEAEIHRTSDGRALIIAGDFNIERRDSTQFPALAQFATRLGLLDTNALPGPPWPEQIDYIFVRESRTLSLQIVRAGSDAGFRSESHALSDHPAMFAVLRLAQRDSTTQSAESGNSESRDLHSPRQ